jgi:uncharacterized protein YodC (DUF2158 family)
MKTFEIGDVVKLTCGGLRMTVTEVTEDGQVKCCWFGERGHSSAFDMKEKILPIGALVMYAPEERDRLR